MLQSPRLPQFFNLPESTKFGLLMRHRTLFLSVFVSTFLLIAAVVFMLPKKYESEMMILVSSGRADMVISPEDSKNTATPDQLPEIRLGSEIGLLKSRNVMEQVIDKIGAGSPPNAKNPSPASLAAYREGVIGSLNAHLKIDPVKKSELIAVTYQAKTPEMANKVLTSLSEAYLELHLKAHATPGSFKFFDDQANSYAQKLKAAEQRLLEFRQKNPSNTQPTLPDPLVQREMEAQAALDETQAQEADYARRVESGRAQLSTLNPRIATQTHTNPQTTIISQLTGMLAELQNRRTEMATKFRPDDRMVTQLDKEIADTRATLEAASANSSTDQTTDLNQVRVEAEKSLIASETLLAGLRARQRDLTRVVQDYKGQVIQNAQAGVESERLERELKESEDNYLLYAKKREEARISESLDQQRITDVSLIESPTMPVRPVSPVVSTDLAIGFFLALLVAYVSVLLWSRFGSPLHADRHVDVSSAFATAPAN